MKRYKRGILLAATKDSAFAIGSQLVNIIDKMGSFVDVFYIVNEGFDDDDKKAMKKIATEIKFISFIQEDFLNKLSVFVKSKDELFFQNLSFLNRYTHMSYALFEGLNLLDECEKILYLDFDILLLKSIKELFTYEFDLCVDRGKSSLSFLCPHLSCEFANEKAFRSGIVCFSSLIKDPKACYEFIYESSAKYNFINDQIALSLLIYSQKLRVKILKRSKYAGELFYRQNRSASIIHAYGRNNRFWNNKLANTLFPQWNECYKKWLSFGGSAYTGGFVAKTTYVVQRFRFHLAYKLGLAMIRAAKTRLGILTCPLSLSLIFLRHRLEQRLYKKECLKKPYLRLPLLKDYDDYAACKEKESMPYKLGEGLIKAFKNWHRGDLIKFFFELKRLRKDYEKGLNFK